MVRGRVDDDGLELLCKRGGWVVLEGRDDCRVRPSIDDDRRGMKGRDDDDDDDDNNDDDGSNVFRCNRAVSIARIAGI